MRSMWEVGVADPSDIERLADVEHESWSKWTTYMLDKLAQDISAHMGLDAQSQFDSLPSVLRWRRQIATPYSELSDKEKESDREVAREKLKPYRGKTQLLRASVEILVWEKSSTPARLLTVTNRRWGGFSCPGGKVEPGEGLADAARRELKEETGCDALSLSQLTGGIHWDEPKDGGFPWFCMAFLADIGDQVPTQQEDGTEIGWHTPAQLKSESIYPDWYRYLFKSNGIR